MNDGSADVGKVIWKKLICNINEVLTKMKRVQALNKIEKAHPIDGLLFGSLGAVAAQMCQDRSTGSTGKQFEFMDVGEFQVIADEGRMQQRGQQPTPALTVLFRRRVPVVPFPP